ncbi:MAG: HEAT repeat domain-containing protein [Planctomycetes bacterium]|nr:HEAT repeat domain-containing protein [Planctomycetota bacterium]
MQRAALFPLLAFLVFLACASASRAEEDPFGAHVRPTEPLSPEDERRSFRLPPGFEAQLVAAEPEIQKPMNLAFDARGRLWVTDTVEYPYAAPLDRPGRDTLKVLEDSDADGRAERVTTFAEGLNIPIGIYPLRDGAIAWSIPNIWRFFDHDGDGVADERRKLYGPLGFERDTHGLHNAFRRHFDGWLYACHGFANESTVAGADGHTVHMVSGNTYRMRLDGSRLEQFTWGQVNPFGMAMDPLGNLFTCDCHSRPIYQLLRDGQYPGFGKPHDGLGFAPEMMEHLHGSTANAGAAFYTGDNFPEDLRGNIFTGNVWTSRINRDSLHYEGTTALAREEPDLVATTDPWFRPVDLQVAPDGTLYVADFYNRIIGHYEVRLDHPGRDRRRGRIWRILYRGDAAGTRPPRRPPDLSRAAVAQLIETLGHPVQTARTLATDELVDRAGQAAVEPARKALAASPSGAVRSHALWVLERLGALAKEELERAAKDPDRAVMVHAMRVLSERKTWDGRHRGLALAGLGDADPFVRRAAADALGQHPAPENVRPLLDLVRSTPAGDTHLAYVARRTLCNQVRDPAGFRALEGLRLTEADEEIVAGVALGVPSPEAGAYLLRHARTRNPPAGRLAEILRHVARHVPEAEVGALAGFVLDRFAADMDLQLQLLAAVDDGLRARGLEPGKPLLEWAGGLAERLLDASRLGASTWQHWPHPGGSAPENPWVVQERPSADGKDGRPFLCSLPRGEQLAGGLRSPPFKLPPRLSFFIAGHDGFPDRPPSGKNLVRLVAASGEVLRQVPAPRHDTAQRVEWDLAEHAGKEARVEIVDGDTGGAYAWIAAGRFEPGVVEVPPASPSSASDRQRAAAAIASRFRLAALKPKLLELVGGDASDGAARAAAAQALLALEPDGQVAALAALLGEAAAPQDLRSRIAALVASRDPALRRELIKEAARALPARSQTAFAQSLAADPEGAESLLALIAEGHASPRLLQRRSVRERILASRTERARERIEELTAGLPPEAEGLEKLFEERRNAFLAARTSPKEGAAAFEKHCAACHQVAGKGKVIGPQLDGIGGYGLDRILEDVLDPNRNVDAAFRTSTFVLRDGQVLTGLPRREEGEAIVIADSKGEEVSIAKADVQAREPSELSLMPESLAEAVPEADLLNLLAFLLAQTAPRDEDRSR